MKHIDYLAKYFGTMLRLLFLYVLSDDAELFEGLSGIQQSSGCECL
jgi:hypothetical protein